MDKVQELSDMDLREALKAHDKIVGPITDSTRNLYKKILQQLKETRNQQQRKESQYPYQQQPQAQFQLQTQSQQKQLQPQPQTSSASQSSRYSESKTVDSKEKLSPYESLKKSLIEGKQTFDTDDSDEDFTTDDEEDEDEESEESADSEESIEESLSEDNDDDDEDVDDDDEDDDDSQLVVNEPKASSSKLTRSARKSTISHPVSRTSVGSFSTKRYTRPLLLAVLIATIAYFIYTKQISFNKDFLNNTTFMKALIKQVILIMFFSPFIFFLYKVFGYYRKRKNQESEQVYDLVNKALEHLQTPGIPPLMPILHIRDTLLSPAERRSKKVVDTWLKAVKFIEENESRVMVELINIDGEDFRAWKWIGSRKN